MSEPDYSRYTMAELEDIARHIDAARFPERTARLMAEIEKRQAALSPRERRRVQRGQIFTQGAALGCLAGALSFPISYGILSALYQSANRGRIAPTIFYDPLFGFATIPLGWFLGLGAGLCWANLRVRREEKDFNAVEMWRDALPSAFAVTLCGCLLSPFVVISLVVIVGVLISLLSAVMSLF